MWGAYQFMVFLTRFVLTQGVGYLKFVGLLGENSGF
jgi:hypothetical protein